MTTDRRVFLLTGWGRFLANHLCEYKERQGYIKSIRDEGSWAIMVADDHWALQYQRLEFRIARAKYAFGAFGLKAKMSFGKDGFIRWSGEMVTRENRRVFHKHYRMKANRAVRLLRELSGEEPMLHPTTVVDKDRARVETEYLELPY